MSDINWNDGHNKKILLEEFKKEMLKDTSNLGDIEHPTPIKWWEFWKIIKRYEN